MLVCADCSINVHGNSTGMYGISHYNYYAVLSMQVDLLVLSGFLNIGTINNINVD